MKKTKTVRILSLAELQEIKAWLQKNGGQPPMWQSFEDAILSSAPSERSFGRYASSSTSSVTIYKAAQLISMMNPKSGWFHADSGEEESLPELHTAIFADLKRRIEANDHAFFECVAIMLRHRDEKKTPIAHMDWRSIKKHADVPPKPPSKMTLPRAMEFAVFHVLQKRVLIIFGGGDSAKVTKTAVLRSELRRALRGVLQRHGGTTGKITDPQLSELLHSTREGKFLAPFMHEQPIMKRKQKV